MPPINNIRMEKRQTILYIKNICEFLMREWKHKKKVWVHGDEKLVLDYWGKSQFSLDDMGFIPFHSSDNQLTLTMKIVNLILIIASI